MSEPVTWAERQAFIHDTLADWAARFPETTEPWVHQSENGLRMWLTDGSVGQVLALVTLPTLKQEET
jgi:hypothetical protein